jgi:hypothetical protein
VQAVNDNFLLAAGITIIGIVPILILRTTRQQKGGVAVSME